MRAPAFSLLSLRYRWLGVVVTILLSATSGWAQAQSAPVNNDASDPPGRVARLSYVDGDLGLMPAGATEWSEASINRPLTTGDRLSTGADGRAELELGGGALRLAGGTDFGFLTLNDQLAQIELSQGTLNLTVRQLDQGQSYEIDTPTLALVVDQPGTFRIDISNDGQSTQVTVLNGNATVYGENNAHRDVAAGRSYDFGDSALDNLMITDIGNGDAFDAWCSERDQNDAQSATAQYVSDDVVGYQDLNSYGDWQTVPDYGSVWFPVGVAIGWAPYRFGHWVWIAPWGWTWVDDLPWGFAPYHYGRWAFIHGNWGWIPGPRMRHPIYAPALVAFVGIGRGPVGWFPLGPGEVYNPWYRASRGYYSNINLTNINYRGNQSALFANINSHYAAFRTGQMLPNASYVNRSAPHGFTVVSGQSFASAGAVQRNLMQVNPQQITTASVLARGIDVPPTAASLAQPRVQAGSLSTSGFQRPVLARRAPAISHTSSVAGFAPQSITNRVRMLTTGATPAPAFRGQAQPESNSAVGNGLRPIEPASAGHAQPDNTQRPGGVSFISSPGEDRARAELPASGLPQVPHFERANPSQVQNQVQQDQQNRQAEQNEDRYEAARRMHDNVPASAYREPTPQPYYQPTERQTPYRTEQPPAPRGNSHPPAPARTQSQPSRSDNPQH